MEAIAKKPFQKLSKNKEENKYSNLAWAGDTVVLKVAWPCQNLEIGLAEGLGFGMTVPDPSSCAVFV